MVPHWTVTDRTDSEMHFIVCNNEEGASLSLKSLPTLAAEDSHHPVTSNYFLCASSPGDEEELTVGPQGSRAAFFPQAPANLSASSLLQTDHLQARSVLEEHGQPAPSISQTPVSQTCAEDLASSPDSYSAKVHVPTSHLFLRDVLRDICRWLACGRVTHTSLPVLQKLF